VTGDTVDANMFLFATAWGYMGTIAHAIQDNPAVTKINPVT